MRYALRRIATAIATLFLVSLIAFLVVTVLPGDAARAILGEAGSTDQAAYHELREQLGLDAPVVVRYWRWLSSFVTGDFGTSLNDHVSVASKIANAIPVTLQLLVVTVLIGLLIAVPLGVAAATKPNTAADAVATGFAVAGVAIPNFFLGMVLILVLAVMVGLFPPSGYIPLSQNPAESLWHMVLPAFCLATGFAAVVTRQLRSSLIEELEQDYVLVARSKGLASRTVLVGHAMRNALIPVMTVAGLQVGTLVGGSVIVETIFALPGMGQLTVNAIEARDFPTVQATLMVVAGAVLFVNLIVDLAYGAVDPRIRLGR